MNAFPKAASDFMMLQSVIAQSRLSLDSGAGSYKRQEILRRVGRNPDATEEVGAKELVALQGIVFGHLRNARVIEFDARTYASLYHEADVYTEEQLCGTKWEPERPNGTWPAGYASQDAWVDKYLRTLLERGKDLPFPERLPFESVFFSYGGLGLTAVQKGFRGIGGPDAISCELIGHLLVQNGLVIEFVNALSTSGESQVMLYPLRDTNNTLRGFAPGLPVVSKPWLDTDGPWYAPYTLMPWVLSALVDLVNSYRTFVLQDTSLFYRETYRTKAKKEYGFRKAIPPPFYSLKLKDALVRESGRITVQRWCKPPEHRYDVRGHERIRIARGQMPLDPKLAERLKKRQYRVFTVESLDQETWRLLGERRLPPKRPEEWLAIRRCFVKNYTKGPEGAPYIPAVRRVPRRRSLS